MDPASGVEPQLRKLIGDKPVAGLETLDGQFGIFDTLPPRAQQTLLEQIAVEAADDRDDEADMVAVAARRRSGHRARKPDRLPADPNCIRPC
jgi:uncharacterized protein YbaP (TraB family)